MTWTEKGSLTPPPSATTIKAEVSVDETNEKGKHFQCLHITMGRRQLSITISIAGLLGSPRVIFQEALRDTNLLETDKR
jgi:hypothetical protein